MKLRPVGEEVLVQLDEMQKTAGVFEIPGNATTRPMAGLVLGVGEGWRTKKKKTLIPLQVRKGDRVIFPWSTGHDVKIGGRTCVFIRERDILGVENA